MAFLVISRRSFSVLQQLKDKITSHPVRIDPKMRKKLEHLSLLSFQNDETVRKVEQTIHSSDIIQQANVNHLAPLYTLLENETCPFRPTETPSKERTLDPKEVGGNASETYEAYLVAPMIAKRESQTVEVVDKTDL